MTMVAGVATTRDAEAFERDGVVCVRRAFPESWIERLSDAIELRLPRAKTFKQDGPQFRYDGNMWDADQTFKSFVLESPAGEIAGTVMGSNSIRLFKDQLFVKEPGSIDAVTPWHHDLPYWCVNGTQICSIWMPLDVVDRSNGAVEYVKGSHKWDKLFNPVGFEVGNEERQPGAYESIPDIEAMRAELDIVSFDVAPGDCIVFHARTIHGGPGNYGLRRRRAYSTRWAGDDAVYYIRPTSSEPIRDAGISPGEPLSGDVFPLVWTRSAKA
jgi:ectoine hydroxylase-related dioxygenase (phytanoyl-CoA dioxygenase family)